MSNIKLEQVQKSFGDLTAVDRISYRVNDGEFFVIVGPSGCGKSTTLRMIAGFERPTTGDISLSGSPITNLAPENRDIRMVFQDYALFPHMTVRKNLTFGLKMNNFDSASYDERVSNVLELVGLPGVESMYPEELSGGQQQRVALARALILEPDVLILDEPLSNLDKQLRDQMQVELKRIQRETGVTTIHVTHNQEEALSLADRVCIMNNGSVEQIGSPEEVYNRPANQFVADFLGDSNLLSVSADQTNKNKLLLDVEDTSLTFQAKESTTDGNTIFFRPEDVKVSDKSLTEVGPNVFKMTIRSQLFTGNKIKYKLEFADIDSNGVTITAYSQETWEVGEPVWMHVPRSEVRLL